MKRFLGVTLIVVGFGFLILTISSMFTSGKTQNEGNQFSEKLESIKKLDLSSTSVDWEVQSYSGDEIIVELSNDDKQVNIHSQYLGDTLKLEIKEDRFKWFSFNFTARNKVNVQVPREFKNELKLQTVSGDVRIDDHMSLSKWQVHTVSGNVMATEISASNTDINTTSGDIQIEQLKSETVKVDNVSGDIMVLKLIGEIDANAVSGDIEVGLQDNDRTKLKTVSGDVKVELFKENSNLTMKTVSGNIFVQPGFTGKIDNKEAEVTINTTSGDIRISEK